MSGSQVGGEDDEDMTSVAGRDFISTLGTVQVKMIT